MSDQLNIGIIGAGMIGDVHLNDFHQDGRGKVTWLAARTRETLETKLAKHGVKNGTLDYHDILNDPAVDAVVIATPPFLHAQMTLEALQAGKHVLLEKPMAIMAKDADKIVAAAAEHPDLVVLECSCRHARLQPKFRAVKQMIDNGDIGEVYHIHHNQLMRGTFIEYNPAGAWVLDKDKGGGGPFMDWGPYDLSFHLGVLNDQPELKSMQSFTRGDLKSFKDADIQQNIEEHGAAYMEFDTGLTYYYERGSGVHCETPNQTRIYGTRGSLVFGFCSWDPPEIEHFYIDANGDEQQKTVPVEMDEHPGDNEELSRHFLDVVLDGAKPMMTPELAAKHLKMLLQILG